MAMSAALSGLSIVWFCVGKSAPREIAVFDIAPRTIGLLLGALGVVLTGDAILYPVLNALAVVAGLLVYSWRQLGNDGWAQLAATSPLRLLRDQFKLALIETSAASFTLGLGFLASFSLTVSELAGLGSGERIAQAMIQAVAALSNTVHPWVAVAAGLGFRRRVIRAGAAQILLGVILLVGLGVGGPPVSAILFGPSLAAPSAVCWGLGLYLLFVSLQTVVCRHILVTRRQTRYVVRANVAAAAFGVPLVLFGASAGGAPGAVAGMAAGEMLIFLFAAPAAVRSLRVASRPAH